MKRYSAIFAIVVFCVMAIRFIFFGESEIYFEDLNVLDKVLISCGIFSIFYFWVLMIYDLLNNDKIKNKFLWVIALIFFSWAAALVYFFKYFFSKNNSLVN